MRAPAERPAPKRVLERERERTIGELQQQFVECHIGATELGMRIERAESATSPRQLQRVVADLPALPGAAEPPVEVLQAELVTVTRGEAATTPRG